MKKFCPPFPSIENAKYTCEDDELTHQSQCNLACESGFENGLPDGNTRTCSCFTNMGVILLPKLRFLNYANFFAHKGVQSHNFIVILSFLKLLEQGSLLCSF